MKLSSLLYPIRCPMCDSVTDQLQPRICPACRKKIPVCAEPRCIKCGKQILSDRDLYCADCLKREHVYVQGRAAWMYTGTAKASVIRYKFANRRLYAPFYAQEMMRCMGGWLMSRHADALIPVPMSKRALRARGFNQTELIAYPLSAYIGVPVREDILMRREGFRQQKELSLMMRQINLQQAFCTQAAEDLPGTVILLDDIYTTGSTIDAAARTLLGAGVKTIYAAYLCVGES